MKIKLVIENVDPETSWEDMIERLVKDNDKFWQFNKSRDHPEKAYIVIEPEPEKKTEEYKGEEKPATIIKNRLSAVNADIDDIQAQKPEMAKKCKIDLGLQVEKLEGKKEAYETVLRMLEGET